MVVETTIFTKRDAYRLPYIQQNIILLNTFHKSHPIYFAYHGLGSLKAQFSFIVNLGAPTKIACLRNTLQQQLFFLLIPISISLCHIASNYQFINIIIIMKILLYYNMLIWPIVFRILMVVLYWVLLTVLKFRFQDIVTKNGIVYPINMVSMSSVKLSLAFNTYGMIWIE